MTTITSAAKTATRRAEESERISRLSLAMLDRIVRQPGAPDMVLHHVASALADLASVLLATTTTTTEGT
jgi:hypothetical protein